MQNTFGRGIIQPEGGTLTLIGRIRYTWHKHRIPSSNWVNVLVCIASECCFRILQVVGEVQGGEESHVYEHLRTNTKQIQQNYIKAIHMTMFKLARFMQGNVKISGAV